MFFLENCQMPQCSGFLTETANKRKWLMPTLNCTVHCHTAPFNEDEIQRLRIAQTVFTSVSLVALSITAISFMRRLTWAGLGSPMTMPLFYTLAILSITLALWLPTLGLWDEVTCNDDMSLATAKESKACALSFFVLYAGLFCSMFYWVLLMDSLYGVLSQSVKHSVTPRRMAIYHCVCIGVPTILGGASLATEDIVGFTVSGLCFTAADKASWSVVLTNIIMWILCIYGGYCTCRCIIIRVRLNTQLSRIQSSGSGRSRSPSLLDQIVAHAGLLVFGVGAFLIYLLHVASQVVMIANHGKFAAEQRKFGECIFMTGKNCSMSGIGPLVRFENVIFLLCLVPGIITPIASPLGLDLIKRLSAKTSGRSSISHASEFTTNVLHTEQSSVSIEHAPLRKESAQGVLAMHRVGDPKGMTFGGTVCLSESNALSMHSLDAAGV
eukprot:Colp12_sorted_trinity150504_noHs@20688